MIATWNVEHSFQGFKKCPTGAKCDAGKDLLEIPYETDATLCLGESGGSAHLLHQDDETGYVRDCRPREVVYETNDGRTYTDTLDQRRRCYDPLDHYEGWSPKTVVFSGSEYAYCLQNSRPPAEYFEARVRGIVLVCRKLLSSSTGVVCLQEVDQPLRKSIKKLLPTGLRCSFPRSEYDGLGIVWTHETLSLRSVRSRRLPDYVDNTGRLRAEPREAYVAVFHYRSNPACSLAVGCVHLKGGLVNSQPPVISGCAKFLDVTGATTRVIAGDFNDPSAPPIAGYTRFQSGKVDAIYVSKDAIRARLEPAAAILLTSPIIQDAYERMMQHARDKEFPTDMHRLSDHVPLAVSVGMKCINVAALTAIRRHLGGYRPGSRF